MFAPDAGGRADDCRMTYAELFYLVEAGQGRWRVMHQITNLLAGKIVRTSEGFLLTDDDSHTTALFGSIDEALRGLYAAA